jgi:hypothetical protein
MLSLIKRNFEPFINRPRLYWQEYDGAMKRLAMVSLVVVLAAALPACAQHGGAHGGGFSGHGASSFHSAPSFHSGFSAPSRSAPSGFAPRISPNRYPGNTRGYAMSRPASPYARPAYPGAYSANRYGNHNPQSPYRQPYRSPYRREYVSPFWPGYGAGYAPWLGLGYWDYPDTGDYGYDDSQAPQNYAGPSYDGYDPQADQPQPPDQQYGQPYDGYQPRPYYQPPAASISPAPPAQSTVTLVFKDGRPSEQIHNYLLSRDSISVWDQHPREIPLSELDIEATEKANRDAGVDFKLPGTAESPHPTRTPGHPAAGRQPEPPPAQVTI